jgi:hypothetical protein
MDEMTRGMPVGAEIFPQKGYDLAKSPSMRTALLNLASLILLLLAKA